MPPNFALPGLTTMVTMDITQASRSMWNLGLEMTAFQRQISHMGVALSFGLSLPMQVALGAASKMFIDLEEAAIRTTTRISDATKGTAVQIQDFVTGLSQNIPLAPMQIEEVIDQITKVGGKLNFAEKMTADFAKFSKVVGIDAREATDVVIRAWTSLGAVTGDLNKDMASLKDMMDKIVIAQESTGFSAHEILEAFQGAGPQAKQFGLDVKGIAEAIMMLGRSGKEGREALTSLNIILRTLQRSFAQHKNEWEKTFGADLVQNWDTMPGMEKLVAIQKGLRGFSVQGRERLFSSIGIEPRQTSHIVAFLDQINELPEFEKKFSSSGATLDRYNKLLKATIEQLTLIWNAFRNLGKGIGRVVLPPILNLLKTFNFFVGILQSIASVINGIPIVETIGRWILAFSLLSTAVVGPLLLLIDALAKIKLWLSSPAIIEAGKFGLSPKASIGQYLRVGFELALVPLRSIWSLVQLITARGLFGAAKYGLGQLLSSFGLISGGGALNAIRTWSGLGNAASKAFNSFNKMQVGLNLITKALLTFGNVFGISSIQRVFNPLHGYHTSFGGIVKGMGVAYDMSVQGMPWFLQRMSIAAFVQKALVSVSQGLFFLYIQLTRVNWAAAFGVVVNGLKSLYAALISGNLFAGGGILLTFFSRLGTGLKLLGAGIAFLFTELELPIVVIIGLVAGGIYLLYKALRFLWGGIRWLLEKLGIVSPEKSGFQANEGEVGEEDYQKEFKGSRPMRFFSAKTLGSIEEYKDRITGQQALIRVASSQHGLAMATAKNTANTAAHTKRIADNTSNKSRKAKFQ